MSVKAKHTRKNTVNKHRRTHVSVVDFDERDIIAAQNGDTGAWYRIRAHFMPGIRSLVYRYRPGYTAQDYRDRQNVAESALLEAVMKFDFRNCEEGDYDVGGYEGS